MKNIHVLPTEKPRIYNSGKVSTFNTIASMIPTEIVHNIYITSDEEIKDGDCIICGINIYKTSALNKSIWDISKKIILTTDQDLIKDGIQAIDDEFLEWFVENPSCESVEVKKITYPSTKGFLEGKSLIIKNIYEIIIPKEEPKQETTLEEFIKKQLSLGKYQDQESAIRHSIELGAKWQQEQDKKMYNEEEVLDLLVGILDANKCFVTFKDIKEWFEQFKNK